MELSIFLDIVIIALQLVNLVLLLIQLSVD